MQEYAKRNRDRAERRLDARHTWPTLLAACTEHEQPEAAASVAKSEQYSKQLQITRPPKTENMTTPLLPQKIRRSQCSQRPGTGLRAAGEERRSDSRARTGVKIDPNPIP